MGFFKDLAAIAPGMVLTMRIMEKNGTLTISVLPDGVKGVRSLDIKGTADELDEGFIAAIQAPMEQTKLAVTNLQEYEEDLKKKGEEAKEDIDNDAAPKGNLAKKKSKAPVKKAGVKKAAPTKKAAAPKKEATEKKSAPPPAVEKVVERGPEQDSLF